MGGRQRVQVVRFTVSSAPDYGPRERWQHAGRALLPTEHAGVLAARALEECALDTLHLGGVIDALALEAGLRLKKDFHGAGMEAHVAGSYNPARVSYSPFAGYDERDDEEEAAYQRWRHAMRAMGRCGDSVAAVACYEQWPDVLQAMELKRGLALLIKWYRLEN